MTDLPADVQPFLTASQARKRVTRRLFEYWQGMRRDGVPPRRTEIEPERIKDILPFILLGDIEPSPFRVRFRLVGTSVAEFSRLDFSGKYLDELNYGARDSVDWSDCYAHVHDRREPVIGNNRISFLDGKVSTYEFCILPLWRGADPAGSFVASESYEGFDRFDIPDLEPVGKRRQR